jgi:GT2 family glycosyltransferase
MKTKDYLSERHELEALKAMPLESTFRSVPVDRTVSRLRTERSLFIGSHLRNDPARPWLTVVVAVEREPDASLAATLASVALQSCPGVRCVLVPATAEITELAIRKFLALNGLRPRVIEFRPSLDGEHRLILRKADYIAFLRHGDRLHPSAATWLAVQGSASARASVITWGALQPSASGDKLEWAQRNPAFHREALLHFPHLRNAFAVSSTLAAGYPGDLVRELVRNNLHLFQIWLTNRGNVTWSSHPEYFLVRAPEFSIHSPRDAATRAFSDYADAYAKLFATMKEFEYKRLAHDSAAPYRLVPAHRASSVAVIIPFRDKPELTLRAIASLAHQTFAGFFEIVLVNNQSSADSMARVQEGIARYAKHMRVRVIDYDRPFNHSDQCNAGVKASLSEVVVFLNNDCEIKSPTAIEEMAAWALRPGVGSVGISVVDPATGKAHAGMEARFGPTNYFDSVVEERSPAALTPFVRRAFGNTFAICAISRETFDMLGGLDAIRFPNGYNDVEYACRAHKAGLHHLSLGHLVATHSPGQSRAQTDESPQKILVRMLYPSVAAQALETVAMDDGLVKLSQSSRGGVSAEAPTVNVNGVNGAYHSQEPNGVHPTAGPKARVGSAPPAIVIKLAQSSFGRPLLESRLIGPALRRVRRAIWPPAPPAGSS